MNNVLDAPSCYEDVEFELKEQIRINDEFVEDAKKIFIEAFNDLKAAGFSEKEIFELLI